MASVPIQIPLNAQMSVSSESISSGFGSYDSNAAPVYERPLKRRAAENIETVADLDELMKSSLNFSPKDSFMKRHRYNQPQISPVTSKIHREEGRPLTRRSASKECGDSPNSSSGAKLSTLRQSSSGNSVQALRSYANISTDARSPAVCKQYCSPRRRINLDENAGLYTRHRLGATFSPLVTGSRKRCSIFKKPENQEKKRMESPTGLPMISPRKTGLRNAGGLRARVPLINRLHDSFETSTD